MEYDFKIFDTVHKLELNNSSEKTSISIDSKKYNFETISNHSNEIILDTDSGKVHAFVIKVDDHYEVCVNGITVRITDIDDLETDSSDDSSLEDEVKSPMPGKVIKIFVKDGDKVKAGDKVAIVEAMKMENELTSPKDGTISKVLVKETQLLDAGQKLVEFKD